MSIVIVNENDIEKKHKNEHEDYEYYKREATKRSDFDQCYVAIYDVPPRKSSYPYHYHTQNTEVFYILNGEGILETVDGNKKISKGNFIVFPSNVEGGHKITNTSETEILSYIDFDTTNSPDIIHYPNSNKIGIIVHNESSTFYKKDSNVDYYDGE
jgi:uncharacterized cupin superfamily protein